MHNNNPQLMTAAQLEAHLGITRNMAYTLLHQNGFPTVQIGSSLFALRSEVDVWVRHQAEQGGYKFE